MSRVHVFDDQCSEEPRRTDSLQRLHSLLVQIDHKWSNIQVGRQGKYSIERLESLEYYRKSTSLVRVLLVCILTPIPTLVFQVLVECLPLRPPSEGWAANWVLWIRLLLMVFLLNIAATSMLRRVVPGLGLTSGRILFVAAGAASSFTGFWIMIAANVAFPIPFLWQLGFFPNAMFIGFMLILTLGTAPFSKTSSLQPGLKTFHKFLFADGVLVAVYPLFRVLYDLIPAKYQGLATLLLPLWKFAAKKFVGRATLELEDFVPQMVAFTSDFFSTLFVSVCMFNSASISVSVIVIVTDVIQSCIEFREVRLNANVLSNLLEERDGRKPHNQSDRQDIRDLVTMILAVARNPGVKSWTNVRLWACLPHPMPIERREQLKAMDSLRVYSSQPSSHPDLQQELRPRLVSIMPAAAECAVQRTQRSLSPRAVDRHPPEILVGENLIVQGLQLLFHSEYLTLVEYIECIIPLVFVVYKSVLRELPNVIYYPEGGNWSWGAVGNILLFAALEVASFVGLNTLLQRKFAFSPLYQLAFVLETQFVFVQAKLFLVTFCLLPYELEHLGDNFSS